MKTTLLAASGLATLMSDNMMAVTPQRTKPSGEQDELSEDRASKVITRKKRPVIATGAIIYNGRITSFRPGSINHYAGKMEQTNFTMNKQTSPQNALSHAGYDLIILTNGRAIKLPTSVSDIAKETQNHLRPSYTTNSDSERYGIIAIEGTTIRVSSAGSLTQTELNHLTLSGSNTFVGTTPISAITLYINGHLYGTNEIHHHNDHSHLIGNTIPVLNTLMRHTKSGQEERTSIGDENVEGDLPCFSTSCSDNISAYSLGSNLTLDITKSSLTTAYFGLYHPGDTFSRISYIYNTLGKMLGDYAYYTIQNHGDGSWSLIFNDPLASPILKPTIEENPPRF